MQSFTPTTSHSFQVKTKDVSAASWVPVFKTAMQGNPNRVVRSEMDFLVTFICKLNRHTGKASKAFYFRLADGVRRKLGWESHDKILVCYDKEDQCSMMLMRHERGYTLAPEVPSKKTGVTMYKATMPGDWSLMHKQFKSQLVAYTIDTTPEGEHRLFFRVKPE